MRWPHFEKRQQRLLLGKHVEHGVHLGGWCGPRGRKVGNADRETRHSRVELRRHDGESTSVPKEPQSTIKTMHSLMMIDDDDDDDDDDTDDDDGDDDGPTDDDDDDD
jgi:hypothetical protein